MKEYKKKMIRRAIFYTIMFILVGISLMVAGHVADDKIAIEYTNGFLFGIGIIVVMYLFLWIRAILNPAKLEKMYIKEKDERNQEIYLRTTSTTLRIFMIGIACLSIYYAFHDYEKVQLISLIIWLGLIIHIVVTIYYRRKL